MSSVWFYTLILSFASGIFLGSFFEFSVLVGVWFLVVASGLAGIAWRKRQGDASSYVFACALALSAVSLGIMRIEAVSLFAPESILVHQLGEKVTVSGEVIREPDVRTKTKNLTVIVGNEKLLVQTDRHTRVQYGDRVTISGTLKEPSSFVTDLGREFNYAGYLQSQGVTYTISFATVTVTDTTGGNPLIKKMLNAKASYVTALESVIPEPEVALGKGLILGVKQALGEALETDFRRAGIIHIVVLSGYNIMIVVNFMMILLGALLPLRARIFVGVISVILFALLVGGGASVVRASVMAIIALLALGLGRRYTIMRALFAAGFVMLAVNPLLLVYDVGFQLSFMATLGLILVAPQFETNVMSGFAKIGIKEFLVATLATQIAVLPLLLYHIGEFSLVALIVNVLVLPVVPLTMLMTFITGVVALIAVPLALPFAYIAYGLLTYCISIVSFFANLPFAAFVVPAFPFVLVIVSYGVLGYWLYMKRNQSEMLPTLTLPDTLRGWTIEVETKK